MYIRRQKSACAHGFDFTGLSLFFFEIPSAFHFVLRGIFRFCPVQPDDGQRGACPAAGQDGVSGKSHGIHLKRDGGVCGQVNRDLILKSGGGDFRGDGGGDIVDAVDHQPGSHRQSLSGIHMVRNPIGARFRHGEHGILGIGRDTGGQNLIVGQRDGGAAR